MKNQAEPKQAVAKQAHDHGNVPVILFFVGLFLFIVGLFLRNFDKAQMFVYIGAMVLSGYHIVIEGIEDTLRLTKEEKHFHPNVHVLMSLAAIGAAIIGDYQEGALLILIFAGAHFLEHYVESKSKKEITNLMKMNPTEARLILETGETEIVPVQSLKIGDQLRVLNGDQIPTDGIILSGYSSIDESAITGESMPVEKTVGSEVFGSTINGDGTLTVKVTKDSQDTLFAKIIELVNESQENMSVTATRIQRLEPRYVNTILVLVPIFILLGPVIFQWSWEESFYRGMVFLTVASPCALAASAVPATLSAISNLAKKGVLFKGGSYLTNLAEIKGMAFDKTGTLTRGAPVVTDFYFEGDADKQQHFMDVIVAMEQTANHPLAKAILAKFKAKEQLELEVENQIGKGLVASHLDESYRIGKPSTFGEVSEAIKGKNKQYAEAGKTVVYFGINEKVYGLIAMMDIPNDDAKDVISYFKKQGIHTTMITGDSEVTGQAIGQELGMDEVIGNVLPENKAAIIQDQQTRYGLVAMVGDGVNDAPALVKADIGIAMGQGTDIAMDVADAVLMKNKLKKLSYAHKVSNKLNRVVRQNIIFAMVVILILIVLNMMGKMSLPLGIIAHEGSTILVLLNGLRLLQPIKDS